MSSSNRYVFMPCYSCKKNLKGMITLSLLSALIVSESFVAVHGLVVTPIASNKQSSLSLASCSSSSDHDHDHHIVSSETRRQLLLFQESRLAAGLWLTTTTALGGITTFPTTAAAAAAAEEADGKKVLTFQTLDSGVRVADIIVGNSGDTGGGGVVQSTSKVNIHILGRLLGKNGWIFENSQLDGGDDGGPYRLQLGNGKIVPGLEEGLIGMAVGGRRRIVVPSSVGYLDKTLEPIPRDFGNRQRLYTTVMNTIRVDRERAQLGSDLAGVVVFDVELLRIR